MILKNIEQGDFVDFGSFGGFYVANPKYNEHEYWVTRTEADRFNRHVDGWVIKKNLAMRIVEKAWEANMKPEMINMYSTDRYFPPNMRPGGEEAYKRKGYPKVKVERVGHVNHLWTKKINRKFEWKGEWICSICGATVRSQSAPLPDAQVNQMSSPSINTLLPISGKTVVEDIKKLESKVEKMARTVIEAERALQANGFTIISQNPGPNGMMYELHRTLAFSEDVIRGVLDPIKIFRLTIDPNGRRATVEIENRPWVTGLESKVIKMAEQTDFVAGTAIMMSIGWSPAPGNRKDFDDGVSRVYEYTASVDPIPPQETSFSSFAAYDEWQNRQKAKIESVLTEIEAWIHGWPIMNRVEIWYPNKLSQMEGPPQTVSDADFSGSAISCPDCTSMNIADVGPGQYSCLDCGTMFNAGKMGEYENMNTHVNDVNTGQKENILQHVSRTGYALFEDGEKCPKCGSTKIEHAGDGDSVNCQMCGDSYKKKKVAQKEFPGMANSSVEDKIDRAMDALGLEKLISGNTLVRGQDLMYRQHDIPYGVGSSHAASLKARLNQLIGHLTKKIDVVFVAEKLDVFIRI